MCWNQNVSLNTFIFGSATLLFIWYNNTYTQYKTSTFDIYFYMIVFTLIFMQLIEFFLWKSIDTKNKKMNYFFSIIGWILVRILQPLSWLFAIPSKYSTLKYLLFIIYFVTLFIVSLYKYFYNPVEFKTISQNGHLYWKWCDLVNYEKIVFIIYLFIALTIFLSYPIFALLGIIFILYSFIIHRNSYTTMWCWLSNSILLYYLINILFILPFMEKKRIC